MSLSDFIVNSDRSSELDDSFQDKKSDRSTNKRKFSNQEYRQSLFLKHFFQFLDQPEVNPTLSGYFFQIFKSFIDHRHDQVRLVLDHLMHLNQYGSRKNVKTSEGLLDFSNPLWNYYQLDYVLRNRGFDAKNPSQIIGVLRFWCIRSTRNCSIPAT